MRNNPHIPRQTIAEVIYLAKQGMARPDRTNTHPKNETSSVPQIQGKMCSGKKKTTPIITSTMGAQQKVRHKKPISWAHGIIDNGLVRDNLEKDIPYADLQDL